MTKVVRTTTVQGVVKEEVEMTWKLFLEDTFMSSTMELITKHRKRYKRYRSEKDFDEVVAHTGHYNGAIGNILSGLPLTRTEGNKVMTWRLTA